MSLLTVNNICKSYGTKDVLNGVSFQINRKDKLGLIGKNGCGKTTLLRILTEQEGHDSGSFRYAKGVSWSYLKQEDIVDPNKTIIDEAKDAFKKVLDMESRLIELEHELELNLDSSARLKLMEEYEILHEHFQANDGDNALRDVPKVLKQLGFREEDFTKPNHVLSGGERTRLALAKLLLTSPDILYLDEPTNHLDLNAVEWLEDFLTQFGGAVVLVSHDRYFLNKVANGILEMENGMITAFKGNFNHYWRQKQEIIERQKELYRQQQEEIKRLDEFVRRTIGTQKNAQAFSRLKMIERIKANGVTSPKSARSMKIKLTEKERSGEDVVIIKNVSKAFANKTLFNRMTMTIKRNDKVGIIGANGAGKSTLIKLILGEEEPTEGNVRLGSNVIVGYFAQDDDDLEPELTVFEHIYLSFDISPGEARNYLAQFLFMGDDVFVKAKMLSGGEKNKLSLAKLMLMKPNLLVLDEPTNHLDMASCDALVNALKTYDGTLLLVSHDRYLLDQTTTSTLELAGGQFIRYLGGYSEYKERKQHQPINPAKQAPPKPAEPNIRSLTPRELSKEKKRAADSLRQAEDKVSELEKRLQSIEAILAAPSAVDDITALSKEYGSLQDELDAALKNWEQTAEYKETLDNM